MDEERPTPESLLEVAKKEQSLKRGKLTIYLGAMPGVGKTYAMLSDAHIKKKEGVDIKIGYVETHGRKETESLLEGLDIIPPLEIEYKGIILKELNLDEVLRIRPKICIVDELPHSNPPGFRNKKRYQDIEEILNNGIDVWTAMNIQHLESLKNIVYQITGVDVKETVPDEFVKNADEIKLIDLPPEELLQRLKEGKVYVPDLAENAIKKYFRTGNIMALRELSMRIAADKLDKKLNTYMKEHAIAGPWTTKERLLVGVYASPSAESLVRTTYRIASNLDAEWTALYVETENHQYLSEKELGWLKKALDLASSLGANVVWTKDIDIAQAMTRYAKSNNITKMIIGKPKFFKILKPKFFKILKPKFFKIFRPSIFRKIAQNTKYIDIYIVDPVIPNSELSFINKKPFITNILKAKKPINIILGLLIITFSTIIGLVFREHLNQLNLVFLFLMALSINAILLDTYTLIGITLLSILVFDYFFIPPYFSFAFSDFNYLMSYSIFAFITIIINILYIRLKKAIRVLRDTESKTELLLAFTKDLLNSKSKEEMISKLVRYSKKFVKDVAVYIKHDDILVLEAITKGININDKTETIVKWCIENKKMAGFSTSTFYQEPYLYIPILYKDRAYGVIVFDMSDKNVDSSEELIYFLETITNLFASSVKSMDLHQHTT